MKTRVTKHEFNSFEEAVNFFNSKLKERKCYTLEKDTHIARFSLEPEMIQLDNTVYVNEDCDPSIVFDRTEIFGSDWYHEQATRANTAGYRGVSQNAVELGSSREPTTKIVVNGRVLDSHKDVCIACSRWTFCSYNEQRERCDVLS